VIPSAGDEDLIRRFVTARDESAFRELYARHSPAVFGLLCRMAGGRADASDLLQEAWMRAAGGLHGFRSTSQFRTWLTGIALNCYREWRRAARRAEVESDSESVTVPDTRGLDVESALGTLAPPFREVLVLHDVEGFTHEEIARAIGIEPGTSKSRLSRARHMFRACWTKENEVRYGAGRRDSDRRS
jgi:RNA polymerase sigma-70 factor (ECF subfamily)